MYNLYVYNIYSHWYTYSYAYTNMYSYTYMYITCAWVYIYTQKLTFSLISCMPLINTMNFYYILTSSMWKITLWLIDFEKNTSEHKTADAKCCFTEIECATWIQYSFKKITLSQRKKLFLFQNQQCQETKLWGDSYIAYLLCGLFWMPVF